MKDKKLIETYTKKQLGEFKSNFAEKVDRLLSLEGESSAKRLKTVLDELHITCAKLTEDDVFKAIDMYVKNQFDYLEPRDNYFTFILFNKIISKYKEFSTKQTVLKRSTVYVEDPSLTPSKEEQDQIVENFFNRIVEEVEATNEIQYHAVGFVVDFLARKGRIKFDKKIWQECLSKARKEQNKDMDFFTFKKNKKNKLLGSLKEDAKKHYLYHVIVNNLVSS